MTPDDVAAWVRFRQTYGLRSDLAWVLDVASDPANFNEMDVPLLPAEIETVARLNRGIQDLVPAVTQYGLVFPAEYAGVYIDGPTAVIQFSDRVDAHRAAIETLFGASAPIEVRQARYSLKDLDGFARQVEADRQWFPTVQAQLTRSSPREQSNMVEVGYKANEEGVESMIRSHFGSPDWMQLRRDGPLPWTGPHGTLRVRIVDRAGRPIEAGILPVSKDRRVAGSFLPREVQGFYEEEGIAAIDWEVVITYTDRHQKEVRTSALVHVPAGGVSSTTVVIDP